MRKDSITLHPKLGVNPRMAFCRRCGEDVQELMLLGYSNRIYHCNYCNTNIYGGSKCPKCEGTGTLVRELRDYEKVPSNRLCDSCEKEELEFAEIVSEGGVYFRCSGCKRTGVIKKNEYSDFIRIALKVEAPNPCGVEVKECAYCIKNKTEGDANHA